MRLREPKRAPTSLSTCQTSVTGNRLATRSTSARSIIWIRSAAERTSTGATGKEVQYRRALAHQLRQDRLDRGINTRRHGVRHAFAIVEIGGFDPDEGESAGEPAKQLAQFDGSDQTDEMA